MLDFSRLVILRKDVSSFYSSLDVRVEYAAWDPALKYSVEIIHYVTSPSFNSQAIKSLLPFNLPPYFPQTRPGDIRKRRLEHLPNNRLYKSLQESILDWFFPRSFLPGDVRNSLQLTQTNDRSISTPNIPSPRPTMTARLMASPVWTASASRPRTNATTGSASLDPSTRNGASCRSSSLSNHLVSVESLRDRVIRWAACSVRPGERIVVVFCTVSTPRIRILHRQLLAIRTPPILSVTAMDGTKTELSVPGSKSHSMVTTSEALRWRPWPSASVFWLWCLDRGFYIWPSSGRGTSMSPYLRSG